MQGLKVRLNTLRQCQSLQEDEFGDRYETTVKLRKKSCTVTQNGQGLVKTLTYKPSIYEQLFRKQARIRRIRHASFEKCNSQQISDFFITNHLQDNLSFEKRNQKENTGFKPLFKIKKRKVYFKNTLNRYRDQIYQLTQSLKYKLVEQDRQRKSPTKGITETHFYKRFKSSIQNKKQRQKQKTKPNAEKTVENSTLRMQHIEIIKKYSFKTTKPVCSFQLKQK